MVTLSLTYGETDCDMIPEHFQHITRNIVDHSGKDYSFKILAERPDMLAVVSKSFFDHKRNQFYRNFRKATSLNGRAGMP